MSGRRPDKHGLNAPLHKTGERRTRFIMLRHAHSGATKRVEYLGMAGRPLRAQIWWSGAGDYLVAPRSGLLCGERRNAAKRQLWQVVSADRAFLNQEWLIARVRARLRIS